MHIAHTVPTACRSSWEISIAAVRAARRMNTHWKVLKAPMISLPVMSEPFERIAMDIVGPLPRSRSGCRYVLVLCDYATRYPEAIALKSIDAQTIAEELIKEFAQVGIPKQTKVKISLHNFSQKCMGYFT